MPEELHLEPNEAVGKHIALPAPTSWPFILAAGCTMIAAGILTSPAVSVLGGVLMAVACIGWFREVLPHEQHEEVEILDQPIVVVSHRVLVERLQVEPKHRAHVPLETYPVLSGIKGGIAGGIAMIVPAIIYGLIAQHSIWYPINLLGGAGVANWRNPSTADIAAFHWQGLLVALVIHASTCLLVGMLYGAMLPMLPRHPILLGGILAPLLWTGLLHSFMGIINPALADRIAWGWFVISQLTFGLTAGLVVARTERIPTGQSLPFAARLGIEAPGLMHSRPDVGPPQDKEKQDKNKQDKEKH